MTRALLVALWEVRAYLKDKADLAFSLLLPIAIFALMYGAFGGQLEFHGTAHVVNENPEGDYSALLLERLGEIDNLDIELLSRSEADRKLERSDLLMVLYIPAGFSDDLTSGGQAQLVFKQRGNGGDEGQIVASMVSGVAEDIAQEFQVRSQVRSALAGTGIEEARIEITVQEYLNQERQHPTVAVTENTLGTSPDPVNTFLPGIVTMFVLFAITLSARALVEERKKGTLERLRTTRLSVGQLFVGKFLANVSRGFIQTLILLALSYAVFQLFTPLSFIEALVVAFIFTAAVSSLGLIIGSVARTEDQSTWIAVFFTMVMVMLGGTFFEISEGSALDAISKVSINTYANDALKTIIVDGGSLADAGLELLVLAGVAVVGLVISRMLFQVAPKGK
jgi:ABC-2 type transport system permease protein